MSGGGMDSMNGRSALWRDSRSFAVISLLFFVIGLFWYDYGRYTAFMGDDLRMITTLGRGWKAYSDLLIGFGKFRPVFVAALVTAHAALPPTYQAFLLASVGLHAAACGFLVIVLRRAIGVNWFLAGLGGLSFLISRATAYVYLPEVSIMEGCGAIALLILFWTTLNVCRRGAFSDQVWMLVSFAALFHIHERYVALVPALVAALFVRGRLRDWRPWAFSAAFGFIVAINVAYKEFGMRTAFLMGTTTRPIELNAGEFARFFFAGAANLFGLNVGPSYLSILDRREAPAGLKAAEILQAIAGCCLLLAAAREFWRRTPGESWGDLIRRHLALVILPVAIVALLAAASVTFRQEYRWLLSPMLVFALMLALICRLVDYRGGPRVRLLGVGCLGFFFALSLACDICRHRYRENFYAVAGLEFSTELKTILDVAKKNPLTRRAVVHVPALAPYNWYVMEDAFADFYHFSPISLEVGNAASEDLAPNEVEIEVDPVHSRLQPVRFGAQPAEVSLLPLLPFSEIGGLRGAVASPSGTAAFVLDGPESTVGETVALVAPYQLNVPCPRGPRGEYDVVLECSSAYVVAGRFSVVLSVSGAQGEDASSVTVDVPAVARDRDYQWKRVQLKLPRAGPCSMLQIGFSPNDTSEARWLVVRRLSVVPHH